MKSLFRHLELIPVQRSGKTCHTSLYPDMYPISDCSIVCNYSALPEFMGTVLWFIVSHGNSNPDQTFITG